MSTNPKGNYLRFMLDGSFATGPLIARPDPDECANQPFRLAEQADGRLFLATVVTHEESGAQSRIRLYGLDAPGTSIWLRNITNYPQGPAEWPLALVGLSAEPTKGHDRWSTPRVNTWRST